MSFPGPKLKSVRLYNYFFYIYSGPEVCSVTASSPRPTTRDLEHPSPAIRSQTPPSLKQRLAMLPNHAVFACQRDMIYNKLNCEAVQAETSQTKLRLRSEPVKRLVTRPAAPPRPLILVLL